MENKRHFICEVFHMYFGLPLVTYKCLKVKENFSKYDTKMILLENEIFQGI